MNTAFAHSVILALSIPSAGWRAPVAQDPGWTQAELEAATERIRGQIEELRGECFLRPVEVRLTDGEGFVRYATARMEELVPEADLAQEESVAKLLGLVPAEMNLLQASLALLEDQVGGFYDPGTDTFYLMDSFTGAIAEVILAHELTHALDDQLYDIDGKLNELLANPDAVNAFSAVVEGSGTSLMTSWMLRFGAELSQADMERVMSMTGEGLADAPPYLWKPLLHAYIGGQKFLNRGYRLRKKEGASLADVVREPFKRPPLSTEQVLHPDKYWKRAEWDAPRPIDQEAVGLPEGWQVLGERTLGELILALLTAPEGERGPIDISNPEQIAFLEYTNGGADGWGGDSVLLLAREGAQLIRAVTLWDRPSDAQEFRAALESYRPEWERALTGLGEEHGLRIAPEAESAPDEVRFIAWWGATEEEASRVAGVVQQRELPTAPPPEAGKQEEDGEF